MGEYSKGTLVVYSPVIPRGAGSGAEGVCSMEYIGPMLSTLLSTLARKNVGSIVSESHGCTVAPDSSQLRRRQHATYKCYNVQHATCNIQPQVVAGSTRRRRANGFLRPCRSRAAPPDYAEWVSLLLKHLGPLWCLGRVRRRALCLQADRWDEYAPATPSAPQGYHMRSLARMHALTRARERASAPLSSHHPVPVHGLVHWPHCRCVTPALSCAECAVVR